MVAYLKTWFLVLRIAQTQQKWFLTHEHISGTSGLMYADGTVRYRDLAGVLRCPLQALGEYPSIFQKQHLNIIGAADNPHYPWRGPLLWATGLKEAV